jgi:hypothetical protein
MTDTDTALTFIDNVHASLNVTYTGAAVTIDQRVNGEEAGKISRPPAISWVFGRILHQPGQGSSNITEEQQELDVEVWAEDYGTARELKNNLFRAAKAVIAASTGSDLTTCAFGTWDWVRGATVDKGRKLKGTITLNTNVNRKSTITLATIRYQIHTETTVEEIAT